MIPLDAFPSINATLNGITATLLVAGFFCIRTGRIAAHRALMLSAFGCSILFLSCYLWYHAHAGSKPFLGQGWPRTVYFAILISHTVLAAAVPFLAIVTLSRGLRTRIPEHKRLARWTLPIWLYVSVTGVVIYAMLYRLS